MSTTIEPDLVGFKVTYGDHVLREVPGVIAIEFKSMMDGYTELAEKGISPSNDKWVRGHWEPLTEASA